MDEKGGWRYAKKQMIKGLERNQDAMYFHC